MHSPPCAPRCSFATIYLSNLSLLYLNYATQVIFKSSKVIPVMIVGSLVWHKRYSLAQYGSVILVVIGLATVGTSHARRQRCQRSRTIVVVVEGLVVDNSCGSLCIRSVSFACVCGT
jgi:adenosine 3'-phospho 5'-phosphosulfate transporter B3